MDATTDADGATDSAGNQAVARGLLGGRHNLRGAPVGSVNFTAAQESCSGPTRNSVR